MYLIRIDENGNKIPSFKRHTKREQSLIRIIERLKDEKSETCQEYENTITELEEIIGTQQRAFLDLINNLELEISRNDIEIDELKAEIENSKLVIDALIEEKFS